MAKKYNLEVLDGALAALDEAPPPENEKTATTKEVIEELLGKITELLDKGYLYEQITEVLKGAGIEIAASTLSTYVRDIRKEQKLQAAREKRRLNQEKKEASESPEPITTKTKPVHLKSKKSKSTPEEEVVDAMIVVDDDDEIQ